MLWSESEPNAGFPSRIQAPFSSQLRLFKELARLRQRNEVLKYGKSYISKMLNSSFAFCRYMEKENVIYGEVNLFDMNQWETNPILLHLGDCWRSKLWERV